MTCTPEAAATQAHWSQDINVANHDGDKGFNSPKKTYWIPDRTGVEEQGIKRISISININVNINIIESKYGVGS